MSGLLHWPLGCEPSQHWGRRRPRTPCQLSAEPRGGRKISAKRNTLLVGSSGNILQTQLLRRTGIEQERRKETDDAAKMGNQFSMQCAQRLWERKRSGKERKETHLLSEGTLDFWWILSRFQYRTSKWKRKCAITAMSQQRVMLALQSPTIQLDFLNSRLKNIKCIQYTNNLLSLVKSRKINK